MRCKTYQNKNNNKQLKVTKNNQIQTTKTQHKPFIQIPKEGKAMQKALEIGKRSATGFILSLILISLSSFIALAVFNRPESVPLIAIASATVFAGALQTAAQSTFVGFERMELNSLTNVCQAIVKSIAVPLLVL
jgi:O-antigen/teichoic acid export membrane protein